MTLFGGIEAGGTKFVCAVGTGPGDLRARTSFPTTTPAETIAQAIAFFKQQPEMVAAIGIANTMAMATLHIGTLFGSQNGHRIDACRPISGNDSGDH